MEMYRGLQEHNVNIDIISHGGRDEYDFSDRISGMSILCNRRMGDNARSFAVENYSLPMRAQREYELLVDVAQRNPVDSAAKRVAHYLFRRCR